MSCWHKTTLLRIPVSALGFKYLREWQEFVNKHEDDFQWEEGYFCESMSDDYPSGLNWGSTEFTDPDWQLDRRDPEHPEIVPGPFLDYYLEDIWPLAPDHNTYGANNEISGLSDEEMKDYLPEYQELFPHFTLKDMEAVRRCKYEWYDGTNPSYFYSDLDEE